MSTLSYNLSGRPMFGAFGVSIFEASPYATMDVNLPCPKMPEVAPLFETAQMLRDFPGYNRDFLIYQ